MGAIYIVHVRRVITHGGKGKKRGDVQFRGQSDVVQSRKVIMAKIRPQCLNQLMQSGANCQLAAACTSGCLFHCHSPKTFVLWPQSIDLELLHYTIGAICEALGVVGQLIQQGCAEGNLFVVSK